MKFSLFSIGHKAYTGPQHVCHRQKLSRKKYSFTDKFLKFNPTERKLTDMSIRIEEQAHSDQGEYCSNSSTECAYQ